MNIKSEKIQNLLMLFGLIGLFANISFARPYSIPLKSANQNFVVAENGGGEEGTPCHNITECKSGLVCQSGKCQKPSLPNITPPSCGNCPPFTQYNNGKYVPKKP